MDTLSLEYFIRVCEVKNISKAAQSLFISQQALSKAISRLEKEFNTQFFTRSRAGVELTEAGQRFFSYALSAVGQHSRIQKTLNTMKLEKKNHVSFGYCTGMMMHFPEHFLSDFMDLHPEAVLSLFSFQEDPYHRSILESDPRIILSSSHPGGRDYRVVQETHTKLWIMMARNHPLSEKEVLNWTDLSPWPLINLNIENEFTQKLQRLFEVHEIFPQYVINPAENTITNDLLLKHQAITVYGGNREVLPCCFAVRPLIGFDLEMDFYLCVHKDAELNPSEKSLVKALLSEMRHF